jgi:hypothetical protein
VIKLQWLDEQELRQYTPFATEDHDDFLKDTVIKLQWLDEQELRQYTPVARENHDGSLKDTVIKLQWLSQGYCDKAAVA